jgi:hypothetical protein
VLADNDLCSGLNAGAIYAIDEKKMIDKWDALINSADGH